MDQILPQMLLGCKHFPFFRRNFGSLATKTLAQKSPALHYIGKRGGVLDNASIMN
jgi:hypothetical protein